MYFSLIVAILAISITALSYYYTKGKSIDNISLHLLIALTSSFLIQSIGFIIYDLSYRSIDTISVLSVADSFPLGATCILFLSIITSVIAIVFSKKSRVRNFKYEKINYKKTQLILIALACLSVIGLYTFAASVGTNIIGMLGGSSKWILSSQGGTVEFESNGYSRFLTSLGTPAFLFYVAYILQFRPKLTPGKIFTAALLFLSAVVPPILLSSRGAALYLFISIVLMLAIKKRLSVKFLISGSIITLLAFAALTAARYDSDNNASIAYAFESRVFYGGGISLFNTSIMADEYASDRGDIYYGQSYAGILTSPIPRSVWPSKPVIAYDQQIARSIYKIPGTGAQAIPAGILGETFMNFGFWGAWLIIPLILIAATMLHNFFITSRFEFLSFLFRGILYPKFAAKLFASGVGFAIMDLVLLGSVIFTIYYFTLIKRKEKNI